jgi:hypothetical protein
MAIVQVNPPGLASTDEGYISSVTVRTGGADEAKVPDATTGQITVSALAATQLVQDPRQFKLITG